jgi:class 3 adenylate cyclase
VVDDVLVRVPDTRWATTVDGASIAYQDLGDTSSLALVVIHGWVSHLEVYWELPGFARFMRRLARNFRVIHFDKRGIGMSERLTSALDLETRMDDVRAVMDAAGVNQAALLGWGTGGPPLALFFAATHPERTVAVCTDGCILERRVDGYPWGIDEEENERESSSMILTWGREDGVADMLASQVGQDNHPERVDPALVTWFAKLARYAATPTSLAAFNRVLWETDIRKVLPVVSAPTAVFYKTNPPWEWGSREQAQFLADHLPDARLVAVEGSAPLPYIEEPELFVGAVERFLAQVRDEEADFDRILATVLFTDIVGSTDTAARVGDREWKRLVERHHAIVRALLARYQGTELDTAGDGFYARFDGPARAVRCAQAIVAATRRIGIEIRAGLHTGEVQVIDGKPGGITVNIGARIASLANGSEVLVSQTVKDVVVGSGLAFEERGAHKLKGVPGSWNLYRSSTPVAPSLL